MPYDSGAGQKTKRLHRAFGSASLLLPGVHGLLFPMIELFVSVSMAFAATTIFVFQFGYWKEPKIYGGFFAIVTAADWYATTHYLPEGVIHPILGIICLFIGMLVITFNELINIVSRGDARRNEVGDE
jgi:hypothetical protein